MLASIVSWNDELTAKDVIKCVHGLIHGKTGVMLRSLSFFCLLHVSFVDHGCSIFYCLRHCESKQSVRRGPEKSGPREREREKWKSPAYIIHIHLMTFFPVLRVVLFCLVDAGKHTTKSAPVLARSYTITYLETTKCIQTTFWDVNDKLLESATSLWSSVTNVNKCVHKMIVLWWREKSATGSYLSIRDEYLGNTQRERERARYREKNNNTHSQYLNTSSSSNNKYE